MPAGATYEPIATQTLGTAAATITFSSIPSTYTDIKVVLTGLATGASNVRIRFNNNSSAVYAGTYLYGNGTSALSTRYTSQTSFFTTEPYADATVPAMIIYDIFSYTGSTSKTILQTMASDKNGSGSVENAVGLWDSTSAINRIDLSFSATTFAIGTTATLYGIAAA
jgi:hypothetical protein